MHLVNTATPFLKIYNPDTGNFASFIAGKLEIEKEDPDFKWVMAEAQRNPAISIHEIATTCDQCGAIFTGKVASAELGKHRKEIHFDVWLAEKDAKDEALREVQVKSRAGYACDICSPVQEFPDAEQLAQHVRLLHATVPELTESGETVGGDEGERGGAKVDTEIPAAKKSGE